MKKKSNTSTGSIKIDLVMPRWVNDVICKLSPPPSLSSRKAEEGSHFVSRFTR